MHDVDGEVVRRIVEHDFAARETDDALAKLGKHRKIAVTVPHFMVVLYLLPGTDMIAGVAEKLARRGYDLPTGLGELTTALVVTMLVPLLGYLLGSIPFGLIHTPWESTLMSTYSGEAWELEQLLALVAMGKVRVEAEHITLDDVPDAYERLDRG